MDSGWHLTEFFLIRPYPVHRVRQIAGLKSIQQGCLVDGQPFNNQILNIRMRGCVMKFNGALVTIENWAMVPNGNLKQIAWESTIYDTQGIRTGNALKVPDGVTLVKIFFQVKWEWDNDPGKSTGFRIAQVRKNGTDDLQLPESRIAAAPKTYTTQNGATPVIPVEAGDLFELWAGQDSGFNDIKIFPHQTWFAMEIIDAIIPPP